MTQAMSPLPNAPMNMTKTPHPTAPTASPASSPSAVPATSTPIYDALVREWYAEGRNPGARRGDGAEAGGSRAPGASGAESGSAAA
ncbi:hypothetical protein RCO28_10295 [Streptomyces sp. LHD-70]|uniref:hypothetical protein n=1 Tax=Streptomyces sp. LHD-70 TaxID=3072140 RepID=UPI00280EA6E8|nr:hypothetical protein [Streptomyces sp. LHD-70]MDQ8702877.1 hypothetical protein [Streptomyces sp. LHD-70]